MAGRLSKAPADRRSSWVGSVEASGRWLLRATLGHECRVPISRYGCWQTGLSRFATGAGLIRAFATGYSISVG